MKWVAENVQSGTLLTIYIRYQYEVRYDLCGVKVRHRTPKPKVVSSIPGWVNIFIITFFLFRIGNTYQANLPLKSGATSSNPAGGSQKVKKKTTDLTFLLSAVFHHFSQNKSF